MSKKQIQYRCEHLTCRMLKCHEGTLVLDKEKFDILSQGVEAGCFNSPSSVCKIGHVQVFKILNVKDVEEVVGITSPIETVSISEASESLERRVFLGTANARIEKLEEEVLQLKRKVGKLEKRG